MSEVIIFPPIEKGQIYYSKQLNDFFIENNINPLIDNYFKLEKLENLRKKNVVKFFIIKWELELKGFNFNTKLKSGYIDDVLWDKTKYLVTNKKGEISKSNLRKFGVLKLRTSYKIRLYEELNFVPIERFSHAIKHSKDLVTQLIKLGYKIQEYNLSIINNSNAEKHSTDFIDNKKIKEDISLSDIYELFVKGAIIFGLKYINNFSQIKHFIPKESYSQINNNERLIDYFKIFQEVNFYNMVFQSDYNRFGRLLSNNKSNFIRKSLIFNHYVKLHKTITGIINDNNKLYVSNMFEKDVQEIFIKHNILTIEELKEVTAYDLYRIFKTERNASMILNCVRDLNMSVKSILIDKLEKSLYNKRTENGRYIIRQRAKGLTLEQIGNEIGVTRERIRQIERNMLNVASNKIQEVNSLLKGLSKDGIFISFDVIKKYINDEFQTFIFIHPNAKPEIDAFDFSGDKSLVSSLIAEFNKLDTYILKNELDNLIYRISKDSIYKLSKDSILIIFNKIYFKKGIYYFRENPSLVTMYEIILKNHFNNYDGLSNQTVSAFKQIYYEVFDDETIFDRSDRAVIARAVDNPNIVLYEKGVYIYHDKNHDNISNELYEKIYNFIVKYESIYIEAVYKEFENELLPHTKNRFELHGKLRRKFPNLYFTKDFVGTNVSPSVDWDKILSNYIVKTNGIIDLNIFEVELPQLIGFNISQYLYDNKNYLAMFNKRYIHVDYIKFKDNELSLIKEEIDRLLEKQTLVTSGMVYNIMRKEAIDFVRRNNIEANVYAFHIIRVFFGEEYYFDYPNIYKSRDDVSNNVFFDKYENTINEVMLHNRISISKIRAISIEENQEIFNMKEFLEYFYKKGYMRVNDDYIARKEIILNEHSFRVAQEIERFILPVIEDLGSLLISKIDFNILPKQIKWNNHLLAHLLINNSNKISVKTLGTQYVSLDYELEKEINE